jgi:RHS repeat-associated protein
MLGLVTSGGSTTETTYYIHADRIGTPQNVTDGSQTSQWSTTYQPFGTTGTITTSGITQNLRFPGQHYDSETGLYNNGARTYDPAKGRYIQSDPIGLGAGTTNTYAYVDDNPFKGTDTAGVSPDQACYPQTLACPASEPVGNPEWAKYWGPRMGEIWLHCGGHTYLENKAPNPLMNECVYDEYTGQLIGPNGPWAGCTGTPDEYDESHKLDHTLHDSGGPFDIRDPDYHKWTNHVFGPLYTSGKYHIYHLLF